MPVCYCPIHGKAGASIVCSHIQENVSKKKKSPVLITARFYLGDLFGDPNAPINSALSYCRICADKYGFPPETRDLQINDLERMSPIINSIVCYDCLMEVQKARD